MIDTCKFTRKKKLLLLIILLSFIPALAAIPLPGETNMPLLKYISKVSAYTSLVLVSWSTVLGIKAILGKWLEDVGWLITLHKRMGIYGTLAFLLHPLAIVLFYSSDFGINLLEINFSSEFFTFVQVGKIALILLLASWWLSTVWRARLSFKLWKFLHLANLFIPPLVFLHGYYAGTLWQQEVILSIYLWASLLIYIAVFIFYLLKRTGLLLVPYHLVETKQITHDVFSLVLQPTSSRKITIKPGQHVYIQLPGLSRSNPFTVSSCENTTGELTLTIKALGEQSKQLQDLELETLVKLEGAYGVFTRELYESGKPAILLAGGIGVTPFVNLLDEQSPREITMFYGNKTEADIAFGSEFEQLASSEAKFTLVNVLSEQQDYNGETGFITIDLLKKYCGDDLSRYDFFVCGPPIMIEKLQAALRGAGVARSQIYSESFGY